MNLPELRLALVSAKLSVIPSWIANQMEPKEFQERVGKLYWEVAKILDDIEKAEDVRRTEAGQ